MGFLEDLAKMAGGSAGSAGSAGGGGLGGLAGSLGGLLGGGGGSANPTALLVQQLIAMLGGGGLAGLVKSFGDKGLGDVMGSWVGTGQNMPISPQQVTNALGSDQIGQLAAKTGLDAGAVAQQLSQILPGLVNHLTPNGHVPDAGSLMNGLSALKGLLR